MPTVPVSRLLIAASIPRTLDSPKPRCGRSTEESWAGEHQAHLASEFAISREVISNIKQGWSWTHVTGHVRPAS